MQQHGKGRRGIPRRQAGLSLIEAMLVLGLLILLVGGAIAAFNTGLAGATSKTALEEINLLAAAAGQYRRSPRRQGLYTGISVTVLATQGYPMPGGWTTGTAQNVYGLTAAIVPATGNTDATLTYQLDTASACQQMIEQFTNQVGIKGTPACAGTNPTTLTLTLE